MPLMAFSIPRKTDVGFAAMNRFLVIPLFLFGGAFYPITQLPVWLQTVVKVLPLWHGVELARGFSLGHLSFSAGLVHAFVLLGWIIAGTLLSFRFMRTRLYV